MVWLRETFTGIWSWLDERLDLSAVAAMAKKKDVPIHRHSFWYYLGGLSLFLFSIQVVTGVLLLFYYRPSAGEAFESIQFLMVTVSFGWLVRSLHAWSANLLIFTLFIHLFSVLFLRAYRKPRELTWYTGITTFFLCLGFGFTGYLLPWNELSYFATKIGTEITAVVPVVGEFALRILRGGEQVTGATLTRFYAIHVVILPALAGGLVAIHLFLVQKHGMSVPPDVEAEAQPVRRMKFFPNFLMRDFVGWLSVLVVLWLLAVFLPAELGHKADPFAAAPEGIRPEWYFMFMFQSLKYLPAHIIGMEGEAVGILAFGLGGLALFLVPVLDRRSSRGQSGRLATWFGVGALSFILVMTAVAYAAILMA